MLLLLAIVFIPQLQHLAWSTVRVTNKADTPLQVVAVKVDNARLDIGPLTDGQSRFIRLPNQGDASLVVLASSGEREIRGCGEYVEGDMYHCIVEISDGPRIVCDCELGVLTSRPMLIEMFR